MNRLVRCSSALYERVLFLYPADLRRNFGNEMTLAFTDDLQRAGVLRVWWSVLYELLTIALPGQQSNRFVLVPALCFLMVALSQGTMVWVGVQHARLVSQVVPVLLMSVFAAVVGFFVACFCSRCPMTTVRLD